jgi:acetyltransferase-like isoleucine patch superfamily enzyme
MTNWRRRVAMSDSPAARFARFLYRLPNTISLPVPGWLVRAFVWPFLIVQGTYHFLFRVLIAEPVFRSYCAKVGKNFHAGARVHHISGRGTILVGDHVMIDGKCLFFFALRYCENPTLRIGDHSGIGHSCAFTIGREITIGKHCRIGGNVTFFDTPGHPNDPEARMAGKPANAEDVRAIQIGDNVWIGSGSTIFPGVSIGSNSVVAYGSAVMSNVPPDVVVAGNPARQVAKISVPGKG